MLEIVIHSRHYKAEMRVPLKYDRPDYGAYNLEEHSKRKRTHKNHHIIVSSPVCYNGSNTVWCRMWGSCCRSNTITPLRSAVLSKFNAALVHSLLLLRLSILFCVVMLFHGVLVWWKEHAPPLREVDQRHRKRARHYHDPHIRQPFVG